MDLGAQYVYPETVGCIYDLEWPYVLLEEEYPAWETPMTYDSSGLRIYDDLGRDIDIFIQDQDIKIPIDSNAETSAGQYIETA